MASEPIVKSTEVDYPSLPLLLTHARPRGSITEATLISAIMMITDVLAVFLALWLAFLVRFGDPAANWPPTYGLARSDLSVLHICCFSQRRF